LLSVIFSKQPSGSNKSFIPSLFSIYLRNVCNASFASLLVTMGCICGSSTYSLSPSNISEIISSSVHSPQISRFSSTLTYDLKVMSTYDSRYWKLIQFIFELTRSFNRQVLLLFEGEFYLFEIWRISSYQGSSYRESTVYMYVLIDWL